MVVHHEVPEELVVLLDSSGRPAGTASKQAVHHHATPLHLAFSCHVVDPAGRLLLTRRAATKRTWPGFWTNACCGHPGPGEPLADAVTRRLRHELGLAPSAMGLAIADFTYRARMDDGTVEHELCPVVVAMVTEEPSLNPDEADAAEWIRWPDLVERARRRRTTLSPWSGDQILRLAALAPSPRAWLVASGPDRGLGLGDGSRRAAGPPPDGLGARRGR